MHPSMELGHKPTEVSVVDRKGFVHNQEVKLVNDGQEVTGIINRFIKDENGIPSAVIRLDGGLAEKLASITELRKLNKNPEADNLQ